MYYSVATRESAFKLLAFLKAISQSIRITAVLTFFFFSGSKSVGAVCLLIMRCVAYSHACSISFQPSFSYLLFSSSFLLSFCFKISPQPLIHSLWQALIARRIRAMKCLVTSCLFLFFSLQSLHIPLTVLFPCPCPLFFINILCAL